MLAPFTRGLSLAVMMVAYALQAVRIFLYGRGRGWSRGDATLYSLFTVLSRLPALFGLLTYHWRQLRKDAPSIIEYKGRPTGA